ncbi:MAG: hypothetical protein LBR60_03150 [Fibrobacter sp.]|jgi:hypothetical protein|nr:hypothetical protein [Fibrobacter sp.]
MQKQVLFLFLLILVSLAGAVPREKIEIEIPLNVGVGPAFFWIPGVTGRVFHPGLQIEPYAVITPKVLQDNKEKIPMKYRKFLKTREDIHLAPLWMALIPNYIVISPGSENAVYGGIWSLFSLSTNLWEASRAKIQGQLILPTLSYLYTHSEENYPLTQHLFGVGAMLRLSANFKFSENFLATLAYAHDFKLPLPLNTYKTNENAKRDWIHTGILSLVFHFRFPITQEI